MAVVLPATYQTLIVSEIVTTAMKQLGLLNSGENPTGDELADGITQLNWMLKSWNAKGCNLWRQTENVIEFPADTATMPIEPYALDILEARLVQSSSFQRPLMRLDIGQYENLPNKAQTGWPSSFYMAKDVGGSALTLWPVPFEDVVIRFTYARLSDDVIDGAQTIDAPIIWTECVYVGLAARLSTQFGVARTDPATAQFIQARADILERDMLDSDRPASVFMSPWANIPAAGAGQLYNF